MAVSVKVHGLDEVIAKYGRIESEMPAVLEKTMKKAVIYAQGEIPPYPAANSAYRRTGTLGRVVTAAPGSGGVGGGGESLTRVEPMGGGVRGVIGGRLKYIDYVVGYQTAVMKGKGWYQLKKVIMDARPGIEKIFRAAVTELFD